MTEWGERTIVATDGAPAAIGPYSQAVRMGGLLFCSGQIPLDPSTGQLVTGNIATQTTPEAMAKQIEDEIANWRRIVEANNIKVD